jgi:predicted unusual protein kinase regulating ubiquinone biosynthesis (AarF/ABC1/UbiB family)
VASGRDSGSVPSGRVRRAAKVGALAGGQTVRGYATRAANLTRSPDARRAAAERRHVETAEQIFEVLGQLKGAAMKVGQVASFIDTSAFPPELQERVQQKLAELRDSAPSVPFDEMRKVVERDLGEPLEHVFDEFDEHAVAAASIGQVYRARLAGDGRRVAVKVQYPGVAEAVRADLQNLGVLMRVAKRIAPGMDAKALTREIRERLTDELDYENEAQSHRAFARAWRGHPFVFVPDVVTGLSGERVLVTEWVDGMGFEDVRALDRAARDRFGEVVFRFFFGSMYRNGHFSGDPHPGNYRLLDDGRVTFLDFGMTKRLPRATRERELAAIRLAMDGEADALHTHLAAMGFFAAEDAEVTSRALLAHFRDVARWYIEDREVTIDRDLVAAVLVDLGDPRSRHWRLMRRETVPPDLLLGRRMEALTVAVLGRLEATGNWHRIMREWAHGEPPATELGELEARFLGRRRLAA